MTAHEDMKMEPLSLEEAFEMASLDNSDQKNVLFFKCEDVKKYVAFYVKKLADFLGCPFSNVQENQGVIEEIVKCVALKA
ncbi:hypothetical protein ACOSP7_012813 [Xanthoceras sorbifolium]